MNCKDEDVYDKDWDDEASGAMRFEDDMDTGQSTALNWILMCNPSVIRHGNWTSTIMEVLIGTYPMNGVIVFHSHVWVPEAITTLRLSRSHHSNDCSSNRISAWWITDQNHCGETQLQVGENPRSNDYGIFKLIKLEHINFSPTWKPHQLRLSTQCSGAPRWFFGGPEGWKMMASTPLELPNLAWKPQVYIQI